VLSLIWTVCGATDLDGRKKVDAFIRDLCFTSHTTVRAERRNGKHVRCEIRLVSLLPRFGSLYDYTYLDASKSR
jgi:hypothetical protein